MPKLASTSVRLRQSLLILRAPNQSWIAADVCLAILDPATWEAAQKAQAKRTRATRPDRPRVDVANRRPKHRKRRQCTTLRLA